MHETVFFAIDGGGTTSRGALYSPQGECLVEALSGPCNPTSDVESAAQSVRALIADLKAEIDPAAAGGRHDRLGLAAAGLVQDERRAAFLAKISFEGEIVTMTDGYAALIGAGGGKPCGLVVAGTGTAGHRLLADGTSRQIGGWGWIGGDQGSGAWIGREALQATLLARDNIVEAGLLTDAVDTIIGEDVNAALDWCSGARAAELGGLAPSVFDAEEHGDPLASAILDQASVHISALATALDLEPEDPLYIVGGVGERLLPRLSERIGSHLAQPGESALKGAFLVASGQAPMEVLSQ